MKVNKTTERKQEPTSKAVNPGGAAQIGIAQANRASVIPLYDGKGYEAPPVKGLTVHPSGTQGKHR